MILPKNGRIAIVDDEINQVLPMINAFSKRQLPFTYYNGEQDNLPEDGKADNDIRILFLDINLMGNATQKKENLRSNLFGVLKRIIGPANYPYLLVYWSRHEAEHNDVVEGLFSESGLLSDRAPIAFLPLTKSDFFTDSGDIQQDSPTVDELFNRIEENLKKLPVYTYLLQWENLVHKSADQTLQDIFSFNRAGINWKDVAEGLVNALGESYAGKDNYLAQESHKRIGSSMLAFTNVFQDSLEYAINSCNFENSTELNSPETGNNLFTQINSKLLLSKDNAPIEYSGNVFEVDGEDLEYESFLDQKTLKDIKRQEEIRRSWKKIWLCVTPLCDFIQCKQHTNKYVRGLVILAEHKKCFHEKGDALFFSPPFEDSGKDWRIMLDFRHFLSFKDIPDGINTNVLYRVKQNLFAEVQSALARHINRQGILFLGKP